MSWSASSSVISMKSFCRSPRSAETSDGLLSQTRFLVNASSRLPPASVVSTPEHSCWLLTAAQVVHYGVVRDFIWHLRLSTGSQEYRWRRAGLVRRQRYFLLEGFQHHLLELIDLMSAESLVGVMRELLRLEADTGVELHFEPLTAFRLDPLAVDALVLLFGPGILKFLQLKALVFQTFDVRPDTLSVVSLSVLKGIPDRIRNMRNSLLWRAVTTSSYVSQTFSLIRSRPFRRSSKPIRWRSGSWLSMARKAGEIFSRSSSAILSHAASTRLLSATFRYLSPSPRQEPGGSLDLSTGLRSSGGHFRWYSVHSQRDSVTFSFHVSAAACSSAAIRCTVTDFSVATATRRSL